MLPTIEEDAELDKLKAQVKQVTLECRFRQTLNLFETQDAISNINKTVIESVAFCIYYTLLPLNSFFEGKGKRKLQHHEFDSRD